MSLLLLLRPHGTEAPAPLPSAGGAAAPRRRHLEPLPPLLADLAADLAGSGRLDATITWIARPDDDEAVIAAAWLILEAARHQE